jgi:hypothetical protein
MLGVGADVYWSGGESKYSKLEEAKPQAKPQIAPQIAQQNKPINNNVISEAQRTRLFAISKGKIDKAKEICLKYGYDSAKNVTKTDYDKICKEIEEVEVKAS